jgi:hypothetical protein
MPDEGRRAKHGRIPPGDDGFPTPLADRNDSTRRGKKVHASGSCVEDKTDL